MKENNWTITQKFSSNLYIVAGVLLFFAVAFGAFGAHALAAKIPAKALETFQTGNRYHFFHALALLFFGVIAQLNPKANLKTCSLFCLIGIVLFSFNCYLYAITQVKTFAMIVPIGGLSFLIAWALFIKQMFRIN